MTFSKIIFTALASVCVVCMREGEKMKHKVNFSDSTELNRLFFPTDITE